MFDFNSFPFNLSEKNVDYICPKCNFDKCVPLDYNSKEDIIIFIKNIKKI